MSTILEIYSDETLRIVAEKLEQHAARDLARVITRELDSDQGPIPHLQNRRDRALWYDARARRIRNILAERVRA